MKITVTKHSKDGLLSVTLTDWINGATGDASAFAAELHAKAQKPIDDRYKAMTAKAKAKAAKKAGRLDR